MAAPPSPAAGCAGPGHRGAARRSRDSAGGRRRARRPLRHAVRSGLMARLRLAPAVGAGRRVAIASLRRSWRRHRWLVNRPDVEPGGRHRGCAARHGPPRAGGRRGFGGSCVRVAGVGRGRDIRRVGRCSRGGKVHSGRCTRRRRGAAAGSSGLAPGPVLERRADRERARQAVRLLVGERARRRAGVGVAAVAMIGDGGTLVAIVLERDEGTGRGAVREGQSAFSHPAMIPARSVLGRPVRRSPPPTVVHGSGRAGRRRRTRPSVRARACRA